MKRIEKLLEVKSIITLAIIFTLCYMVITNCIEPATFTTIAGSVVTYYFTRKDDKNGSNSQE